MTLEPDFDPSAPLAGPPDPWAYASTPSRRDGPPYHMTEMIAAEPALARRVVERVAASGAHELAEAIRAAVDGRGAGDRDRLRDLRDRGHGHGRDPPRGPPRQPSRTRSSRPTRRSSWRSIRHAGAW